VFAWGSQTGDAVALSGTLAWSPTRFVGAAALGPAQQDLPSAGSLAEALASVAACPDLAAALGSFGTCDTACVSALCGAALAARLEGALASADGAGSVQISATGNATTDDTAAATAVAGHFLGTMSDGAVMVSIAGDVQTTAP
jgi:hypothetical protein